MAKENREWGYPYAFLETHEGVIEWCLKKRLETGKDLVIPKALSGFAIKPEQVLAK